MESFAWSPDGVEIVFAARNRGASDLYVVRLNNLSLRQLSGTPMANKTSPSWGPGGERIAFASDRDGATNIYTASFLGAVVMEQVTRSGDITEPRWVT